MPGAIQNVQALRGIACLLVVLFHLQFTDARHAAGTPVLGVFQWFGFAGVDLFFVLSGFIIAHTNRRNLGRPAAVPGYLVRRLWRIYPTYWAAMLACVAATTLLVGFPRVWRVPAETWAAWFALAPVGPYNLVIGQAWTLTYEVMFYLAFGVLMLLPPRLAAAGLIAWGAAAVAALADPTTHPTAWSPVSPFVLEFLAGCLVAHLAGRGVTGGRWAALIGAAAWAVTGAYLAPVISGSDYLTLIPDHRPRVLVWGVPAALVVYAAVAAEARSNRRPPRWLLTAGDASYSIYLLHFQVMVIAVIYGVRLPHTPVPHALWLAATLAGCVAVGVGFYYAVERPLLNVMRRTPRAAAVTPVAAGEPEQPTRAAA